MNAYVNHFSCSKNNDTGETIVQFFQATPHIVTSENGIEAKGVDVEPVASVVMTEQNAREFLKILTGVLQ